MCAVRAVRRDSKFKLFCYEPFFKVTVFTVNFFISKILNKIPNAFPETVTTIFVYFFLPVHVWVFFNEIKFVDAFLETHPCVFLCFV